MHQNARPFHKRKALVLPEALRRELVERGDLQQSHAHLSYRQEKRRQDRLQTKQRKADWHSRPRGHASSVAYDFDDSSSHNAYKPSTRSPECQRASGSAHAPKLLPTTSSKAPDATIPTKSTPLQRLLVKNSRPKAIFAARNPVEQTEDDEIARLEAQLGSRSPDSRYHQDVMDDGLDGASVLLPFIWAQFNGFIMQNCLRILIALTRRLWASQAMAKR